MALSGSRRGSATGCEPMIKQAEEKMDEDPTWKQRCLRRCPRCPPKILAWMRANALLILTSTGITLGIIIGALGRLARPSTDAIMLMTFPGDLFMGMLKMVIIPLLVSSLISGLSELNPRNSGKMGTRAVIYYLTTTVLAAILGIILVMSIHPGDPKVKRGLPVAKPSQKVTPLDAILDLIRNLFPENIVRACFQNTKTVWVNAPPPPIRPPPFIEDAGNDTDATLTTAILTTILTAANETLNATVEAVPEMVRKLEYADGMNVLGIIVFSVAFGIVLSQMGDEGRPLVRFFAIMNEVVMRLVGIIMWYAPLGICCLIAGKFWQIQDMGETYRQLGLYMLTVISGLVIHLFITLQLTYFIVVRKNPFVFLKGMVEAALTALGTSSSTATLPITFKCLEERNKVDRRVTRFVCPVGATVNMDGTALLEAVAAIFIAQMHGVHLDAGKIITLSLTATAASIGAASVPSAGLIMLILVLNSMGLPTEDVGLLFTIDWFLDRLRTCVNVLGDAYGAGIVYHLMKDDLRIQDEEMARQHQHHHVEEGGDHVANGFLAETDI